MRCKIHYTFIAILMFSILYTSLASASLGIFKQNDCVPIVTNLNASSITLSIVTTPTPSSSIALTNQAMTSLGGNAFNYSFCNTSKLGNYNYGYCDQAGNCYSNDFEITATGVKTSGVQISIYILFLLLCLGVTFLSILFIKSNTFEADKIDHAKMYLEKKKNEATFYLKLIKRKLWIVGVFGIYLSLLIFVGLLSQVTFSLGLTDLSSILTNFTQIFFWGVIPFCIFWIVYLILFFWKSTEAIMKYQFGAFKEDRI